MQVNLIIAEWNANGILNRLKELEIFLKEYCIDIMLISESHLTNKSHCKIQKYDVITANHPENKARGGAAILIKSTIKYEIADPIAEPYLQAAGIKIVCDNCPISIYSVYFPPRYNVKCDKFENFFKALGNKFIVGGDFNAKHPWWGSRTTNPKGNALYKCVNNKQCNIMSTGSPTFWPSNRAQLPDLLDFFVYKGISQTYLDIVANDDLSSDHSPIILNYRTSTRKLSPNRNIFTKSTDRKIFQRYIDEHLDLNVKLKSDKELDFAVEEFTKLLHEAAFQSTPQYLTKNISSYKISFEIRQLIARKRRLRKIWHRTRSPSDKSILNRATNQLKYILKGQKNERIHNFLTNLSPTNNNEFKLYRATKYLRHLQKRNICIKDQHGVWCRSDKSKTTAFKTYLEQIFSAVPLSQTQDDNDIMNLLDVPCPMDFPIKPFRIQEVVNEVKKLKSKKSPGFDLIDSSVIKALPKKGYVFMTVLFNSILRLSHFPTPWKCAKIIMILKPNKPENIITSYRPISLLPILSKLFERLFQKRLLPVLESINILPDHQFGLRRSHGTPEQCHRVINVIRNCLEVKKYCSSVFLDVKQAFDKV